MFDYSTTGILASIRDLIYAGSSTRDWPDAKLLRVINREIGGYLLPMMMSARRNHLATYTDQALVASQAAYWLPTKAAGSKARALTLVDSVGAHQGDLVELDLEQAIRYSIAGKPCAYFWRGNQIVLVPTPTGTQTLYLRVHYLNRPSTLVLASACVPLTSGSQGGANFTVNFSGTIPSGYSNGTAVDIVQGRPGFDVLFSGSIVSQTASSLTFTGTLPAQLLSGDWVALSDTAPVVTGGIPEIVVGCLLKKVALETMSARANDESFRQLRSLKKDDEKLALQFLNRRNTGAREKAGAGSLDRFRGGGG